MTQAKEKARELVDKFMPLCDGGIGEVGEFNPQKPIRITNV